MTSPDNKPMELEDRVVKLERGVARILELTPADDVRGDLDAHAAALASLWGVQIYLVVAVGLVALAVLVRVWRG